MCYRMTQSKRDAFTKARHFMVIPTVNIKQIVIQLYEAAETNTFSLVEKCSATVLSLRCYLKCESQM